MRMRAEYQEILSWLYNDRATYVECLASAKASILRSHRRSLLWLLPQGERILQKRLAATEARFAPLIAEVESEIAECLALLHNARRKPWQPRVAVPAVQAAA